MAVELKDITVSIPKQVDDVLVLLVDVVKTVKAKGDLSALLPDLIAAIDGAASIPEEAKAAFYETLDAVALRGVQIAKVLVG